MTTKPRGVPLTQLSESCGILGARLPAKAGAGASYKLTSLLWQDSFSPRHARSKLTATKKLSQSSSKTASISRATRKSTRSKTAFVQIPQPRPGQFGALRTFQGGSAVLYPFASWELKCVERAISYVMQQNPTCPNCGRAMTLRRTTVNASPVQDDNIFQCPSCQVVYLTPDHVPSSGPAAK